MSITIKGVTKRFGHFLALDAIDVVVPSGNLVALLGPSGSGKTTLLRIIAGLEAPDSGSVRYDDEEVTHRPARERHAGFVFQHYALFRHMSVFENVAFGLRIRRRPKDVIAAKVMDLLRLVGLEGLERRFPSQLSGGQRQRVALARALAIEPKVLLLDEPFGALDAKVRTELRRWLRRLHDEIHVTSVFVTHDQEEAFEVADEVVIMNHGRVEQVGTPENVFEHPASPFVLDFLGHVNKLSAEVGDGTARIGNWSLDLPTSHPGQARVAPVYIRPHEVDVKRTANGHASLKARIEEVHPVGAVARLQLRADDINLPLQVELSRERFAELKLQQGETVFLSPRRLHTFPTEDYSI